ncbi:MAG TPA: DUF4192 family protein [Microbacterium sp.]|uniref:DUF4192 family protein n=1 Tax=Microbacterium sp. TaxID=51671 RepID=UPI002B462A2E|nr:DUF4192 family protein [Microbacterium sp.]HKT57808.1 DUF4192 family protein [Microbacterium sp.]
MTTIIKAADAAQFLGLVPHLLGFRPTRSMVLVPFAGSRSLGAMRIDLEPQPAREGSAEPAVILEPPGETVDRLAATAIGMVCRIASADAVAVVIYTDETIVGGCLPREQLARAVARRADACGIELRDALCVAGNGWASYLDPERPADGRPLDLLHSDEHAERLLPLGDGDQHSGARLPTVDPARLAEVTTAVEALTGALGTNGTTSLGAHVDPRALHSLQELDDVTQLLERMIEWDAATAAPFEMAVAVLCLSRPALRDIALLQWSGSVSDGVTALEAQLRWEDGEPYPEELGTRVWGQGPGPDPERLESALQLARHCAALTSGVRRATVLGMCAWLSWAQGRSTEAGDYAAEACASGAEMPLAEVVLAFVNTAHLPDWAFQRAA